MPRPSTFKPPGIEVRYCTGRNDYADFASALVLEDLNEEVEEK